MVRKSFTNQGGFSETANSRKAQQGQCSNKILIEGSRSKHFAASLRIGAVNYNASNFNTKPFETNFPEMSIRRGGKL